LEYKRKWRLEHLEYDKKRKKEYQQTHKSYFSNYQKMKYAANENYRKYRKEYNKGWIKKNLEQKYTLNHNYRARRMNAEGEHTTEEWENLKKIFNYKCAFCGKETFLTRDHKIPLSKGGNNFIVNLQPLCRSCNSKKNNNLMEVLT
jgi:5-methylcytosine-specific restriction endonuclease McrA